MSQEFIKGKKVKKTITITGLFKDISKLIENAKRHISKEFNITHVLLNWHIGYRINQEILKDDRADYGKHVISELADQLKNSYGIGYDKTALSRMIKFSKIYPDAKIVATLSQQLSWSHVVQIIAINDDLKRSFYTEMCLIENWDVRTLREKTNSMLFERTALAKKPEKLVRQEIKKLQIKKVLTPEFIFHDPYFLKFTGLESGYSETDLENTILNELTTFLQEFGSDFCFVAKQKRMSTENTDRFLDLLFFHRGLVRLIAIELKIGRFEPAHKGQMEWYLNWLDKNERKPNEEKPLGIILCSDKDLEDIEYLELDKSGIHVAQYLTQLPPKKILEAKLKQAIAIGREKYARLQSEKEKNNE
jgi:predicted nuclease of restriction endonuclease-like (RecB) superfamily